MSDVANDDDVNCRTLFSYSYVLFGITPVVFGITPVLFGITPVVLVLSSNHIKIPCYSVYVVVHWWIHALSGLMVAPPASSLNSGSAVVIVYLTVGCFCGLAVFCQEVKY